MKELLESWINILDKLSDNNLILSGDKTVIAPKSVRVVGWIWQNGKLAADMHKINPLTVCEQPENVKKLRSFLGAYRVISCCIPNY